MAKRVIQTHATFWTKKREITIPIIGTFGQDYAVYSVILIAVMFMLGFIPFIKNMGFVLRWMIIPLGLAWILDRQLVDGKSPVGFIRSSLTYLTSMIFGNTYIKYRKYKKLENYSVKGRLTLRKYEEEEEG